MNNIGWSSDNEMKESLEKISISSKEGKSGLPIVYDKDDAYILNSNSNTLVVGVTGSGKTQSTILPQLKIAIDKGDNVVVNDVKGEIYALLGNTLDKEGYKTVVLNFDNPEYGNAWNPLGFAYHTYKSGMIDKSLHMIEDLGYYLLNDPKDAMSDPFWTNTTIDYFTGIVLYLFDNAKEEEINLNSVARVANDLSRNNNYEEFMNQFDKNSTIYINLSGTLLAPPETRASIVSVFNQKIKKYISFQKLSSMLSYNDFDIDKLFVDKTAVFIISGLSSTSNSLLPLFVNQAIDMLDSLKLKNRKTNIILDEFDSLLPINNFAKLINYARSINVVFTTVIRSYIDLKNTYGEANSELIKSCFSNCIYLLASDIYTLDEVSRDCGMVNNKLLITPEELKLMGKFEAIITVPRSKPMRAVLTPYYKLTDYNKIVQKELSKRKEKEIKIYNV